MSLSRKGLYVISMNTEPQLQLSPIHASSPSDSSAGLNLYTSTLVEIIHSGGGGRQRDRETEGHETDSRKNLAKMKTCL